MGEVGEAGILRYDDPLNLRCTTRLGDKRGALRKGVFDLGGGIGVVDLARIREE